MSSHIKDWDSQQVVEWLNGVYKDNPKRAAKLGAVIEENGFTGEELLGCETVEELQEALEIKKIVAKSLFKEMQTFKGRLVDDAVDEVAKSKDYNIHVMKTKDGLAELIQIFTDVFGIEMKGDDKKEQTDPEEDDSIKSFQEQIRLVGAMAKDFVKSLFGIRLEKSVTQEIIEICFDYRKLLKGTVTVFGEYSSEIMDLEQLMSQISYTFSMPSKVISKINEMDAKNKQTAITKLRRRTAKEIRSSATKFSDKLHSIERKHIPKLQWKSREWTHLMERIVKLLRMLKEWEESRNEQKTEEKPLSFVRKQMERLKHASEYAAGFLMKYVVTPIFSTVSVATAATVCAATTAGGIALAVVGSPVGAVAGAAIIMGSGAGVLGAAAAIGTGAMTMMEEGDRLMDSASNKSKKFEQEQQQFAKTEKNMSQIKQMQEALQHMSSMSELFGNMIDSEVSNFRKIKDHAPLKQLNTGGFNESEIDVLFMDDAVLAKIRDLGLTILECTKLLNKSRKHIELVEKTCAKERDDFGKNILTPLTDMLTGKGKAQGQAQK